MLYNRQIFSNSNDGKKSLLINSRNLKEAQSQIQRLFFFQFTTHISNIHKNLKNQYNELPYLGQPNSVISKFYKICFIYPHFPSLQVFEGKFQTSFHFTPKHLICIDGISLIVRVFYRKLCNRKSTTQNNMDNFKQHKNV